MFENLNPEVRKVLNQNKFLLNSFSTESKLNILKTAQTGNSEVLKQQIEHTNLGADY